MLCITIDSRLSMVAQPRTQAVAVLGAQQMTIGHVTCCTRVVTRIIIILVVHRRSLFKVCTRKVVIDN